MAMNSKVSIKNILFIFFIIFLMITNNSMGVGKAEEIKEKEYTVGRENPAEINEKEYIYKQIKIKSSIENIDVPKLVYENEFVFLYFKITDIKEKLNEYKGGNIDYKTVVDTLELLGKSDCNFIDFGKSRSLLKYFLSDLLEDGKFMLKEKKTNSFIKDFTLAYYSWSKGPLYGENGRLFLLSDGTIFFKIVDGIS
jgi:hypothetical protein